MKPLWQRKAVSKYRKALRATGHKAFKSAMREYNKLLPEHCHNRLTDKGEAIFEQLQTLRHLKNACTRPYHRQEQAQKRYFRKIQNMIVDLFNK
jgi:hypothetical protein